jgi:Transposase IS116/IS110/IS902 family
LSLEKSIFLVITSFCFKKQEIKKVDKELKALIKPLGMQLETMPGINTVTASAFIAEIGDIHRFFHSDKLARYAGIAPVRMGSGGKETGNYTLSFITWLFKKYIFVKAVKLLEILCFTSIIRKS